MTLSYIEHTKMASEKTRLLLSFQNHAVKLKKSFFHNKQTNWKQFTRAMYLEKAYVQVKHRKFFTRPNIKNKLNAPFTCRVFTWCRFNDAWTKYSMIKIDALERNYFYQQHYWQDDYIGQSIQELNKYNLRKTAFQKFERVWSAPFKYIKGCLRQIWLGLFLNNLSQMIERWLGQLKFKWESRERVHFWTNCIDSTAGSLPNFTCNIKRI